jgi:Mg-chelatase subunit ChlD
VDVVNEEIPMKEDTLYMLMPSESVRVSGRNFMEGQTAAAKDAIVVFCIDISGSMGCTTEVLI